MTRIKVQDKPSLVRDSDTGAIINTNNEERERFIAQREAKRRKERQAKQTYEHVEQLEERVSSIEQKLDAILDLLVRQNT